MTCEQKQFVKHTYSHDIMEWTECRDMNGEANIILDVVTMARL